MKMIIRAWIICCSLYLCINCSPSKRKPAYSNNPGAGTDTSASDQLSGKDLSLIYCSMCHKYPDPSLLTKNAWMLGVLPNMGRRLGILSLQDPFKEFSAADIPIIKKANIFPDNPLIPGDKWKKIVDYYNQTAPDSLPPITYPEGVEDHLNNFKAHFIRYSRQKISLVTYTGYNPFNNLIYIGDYRKNLVMLNNQGKEVNRITLPSPVICVNFLDKNQSLVTCVGILNPNEQSLGRIYEVDNQRDTSLIIQGLQRPVYTEATDLNQDGRIDLVVSEFGNQTGKLSWFENLGNHNYKKHILIPDPGSIKTQTFDINHDGLPDIAALLAQGDERIMIFYNKGHGIFEPTIPLRFVPVSGSLYFELVDFNHDGWEDILYCSGDNADKSPILKPYHGIYLFLNDGMNNFKQAYFFPMNGCIKALPFDYDGDGDLDIAAISFFPDYSSKRVLGFMYLENVSRDRIRFRPRTFPENETGRWLVMDRADMDRDGDMDLVIGSFLYSVSPVPRPKLEEMIQSGVNIIYLENTAGQKSTTRK